MDLVLTGVVATGSGRTRVRVSFAPEDRVLVEVLARWMGDEAALDVVVRCRHEPRGSHSGIFIVEGAFAAETNDPFDLPPSDGPIILEYVRVPPQTTGDGETFTMVSWLHPDAAFDDGTDLEPDDYDVSPERFRPVARALGCLARPWKLG